MPTESRTNRTDPSAKAAFIPPVWKAKASLLFVQLIGHGPGHLSPSAVKPCKGTALAGSAHPAPVTRPLTTFAFPPPGTLLAGPRPPRTQWAGRPASSTISTECENPSVTSAGVDGGPVSTRTPFGSGTAGTRPI